MTAYDAGPGLPRDAPSMFATCTPAGGRRLRICEQASAAGRGDFVRGAHRCLRLLRKVVESEPNRGSWEAQLNFHFGKLTRL